MSEVLIRASSKKVLPIFDEEKYEKILANELAQSATQEQAEERAQKGAIVKINVRRITRNESKRFAELNTKVQESLKSADKESGAGIGDEFFSAMSEMIMLQVCEDSKEEMTRLMDTSIGTDQYGEISNAIQALFGRGSDEKKPGSQSLEKLPPSASTESDSTNKDTSDPANP